ncbi:hypothetical protein FE240_07860 [Aeromonas simiae]|uniref:Uncharacterized protein n=2 Tax=Aeromonas simiae TaxID=218936 RepID=A0A5J6WUZ5_9GAMM|nr:hypothetical protein FE240_07860 [Aeromonas simiae]
MHRHAPLAGAVWMMVAGLCFAAVNSLSQYVSFALGLPSSQVAFHHYLVARAYSVTEASFVPPFDVAKLPLNLAADGLVFGWALPGHLWLAAAIIICAVTRLAHLEPRQPPILRHALRASFLLPPLDVKE